MSCLSSLSPRGFSRTTPGAGDPPRQYLIGLVATMSGMPRNGVLSSLVVPGRSTAVTFACATMGRATDCLDTVIRHRDYQTSLRAVLGLGLPYQSAALGHHQLASVVRPGDLWAVVVYHKDDPIVVSGGYSDVNDSLMELVRASKWRDVGSSYVPVELLFEVAAISELAFG